MRVSQCVACKAFPCPDVEHDCYVVPDINLNPESVSLVMISEATPVARADYYYVDDHPAFAQTTVESFRHAGANVASMKDLVNLGVYLTTAVKCAKTSYAIQAETIRECSKLLAQELKLFPKARVLMLMGDVAIKAMNAIAQRAGEARVIPAVPTYKLRGQEFFFRGMRVIPSYLQVGGSILIEKGKRTVIAKDIARALQYLSA